ncbi:MAG: lipoate--protein ligase [Clostridia bacterium]|nr:lipoate--protein ligase [Clostridia bacterium]
MINKLTFYISDSFDVYSNMALEKHLTLTAARDECVLYLWRNERTVVIGRNQNCWAECRVSTLEADGGHLARRLSGGGAVYHDVGNLNFTFAASAENYDVARQCRVIAEAVGEFGLCAEVSGRNDILIDGAKFSGNAFWRFGQNHYHHGTILIRTDTEAMARYLSVDPAKLKAKGVSSVRSRVVNLAELSPDINVNSMTAALRKAFGKVYGLEVNEGVLPTAEVLEPIRAEFAADEWKYSRTPEFSHKLTERFAWGGIMLELDVREGYVVDCEVFSDALDSEYIASLAARLIGNRYDAGSLCAAIGEQGQESRDIAALLRREI